MKKYQFNYKTTLIIIFFSLLVGCEKNKNFENTPDLIEEMKNQNDGEWFQHFTFKQNTLFFDENEKLKDSAIWYEAVSYPYLFRIDRDLSKGNYTIYRNDSTYHILSDTLYMASNEPAKHLLFKGGLYFVSLDEAIEKLTKYNIDPNSFRKDTYRGNPVYVIGADDNQVWLHADYFYCIRRIGTSDKGVLTDVVYNDFIPLGKGWVEQKVTFFVDGKKRMEEFYFDIKLRDTLDPKTYGIKENHKWYTDY